MEGTVKRWLTGRGYGFIGVEEDDDIFVHYTDLQDAYALMRGARKSSSRSSRRRRVLGPST